MGMTPDQRLRPGTVYRLNSELEDIRAKLGADTQLQPTLYSRRKRRFHWLAVHPKSWNDRSQVFFEDLRDELKSDWSRADEDGKAIQDLEGSMDVLRAFKDSNVTPQGDQADAVLDAMLQLYSRFPLRPDLYMDGILHRQVCHQRSQERSRRLAMFEGILDHASATPVSPPPLKGIRAWLAGDPSSEIPVDDERQVHGAPTWLLGTLRVLMRLEPRADPQRVLVVPLYDHLPEYGGMLLGGIHVLGRDDREFTKEDRNALLAITGRLARGLQSSALGLVGSERITVPPDRSLVSTLIEYFVQAIVRLHDWDRVVAFRSGRPELFWCRKESPLGEALEICTESDCQHSNELEHLRHDPRWLVGDDLRLMAEHGFLSQLSTSDQNELKEFSFAFRFPKYAILSPRTTASDRGAAVDAPRSTSIDYRYWRDRLDVWNIIVPKVRALIEERRATVEARRATEARDKLATVAIVGRNMSHNIGSHILSKLSDPGQITELIARPVQLAADGPERSVDASVALSTLNAYLRDRMDLIADLATTDPSWTVPVKLGEIVNHLRRQTLVLKWLTDGEAAIQGPAPEAMDAWIDLPHGVVGMQAFYVIVENILRNSYRHGEWNRGEKGRLTIHALPAISADSLVLDIVDHGSRATAANPINANLHKPFYDDHGQLSRTEWGLKEMKIGAAFLRRRPPQSASGAGDEQGTPDYPSTRASWIEALAHDGDLAWRLKLLRPKRACVVCDVPAPQSLASDGVAVERPGQIDIASLRSYPMLVCLGKRANEWLREFLKVSDRFQLPVRLLTDAPAGHEVLACAGLDQSAADTIRTMIAAGAADDVEEHVWSRWLAQLRHWAACPAKLVICDKEFARDSHRLIKPEDYLLASNEDHRDEVIYQRHFGTVAARGFSGVRVRTLIGYEGDSDLFSVVRSMASEQKRETALEHRMLEAGLVSTVLFDERLSRWRKENDKAARWLTYSHVLVQNLLNEKNVQLGEIDAGAVEGLLDGETPALLIVSVHKNLLDKVVAGPQQDVPDVRSERVRAWVGDIKALLPSRVIVTVHSGRGRVGSEFGLPFVEYSNIERYVRDSPSPFHLVNLFMSLREN